MGSGHYTGEDGWDLIDYLSSFGYGSSASFKGYNPFQELLGINAIIFERTNLRLKFDSRDDEHYIILTPEECEGIELMRHSGRGGKHKIKKLLENSLVMNWEIDDFNKDILRD